MSHLQIRWEPKEQLWVWLLFLCTSATPLTAQNSVLDRSFQAGAGADAIVHAVVVQGDQRILAGGEFTHLNGQSNGYLARLSAEGVVDGSFSSQGETDGSVWCLVAQPDRRVLVGGAFGRLLGVQRHGLARLLEDGSVDSTFDAGTLFDSNGTVCALACQEEGWIVAGYATETAAGVTSKIIRVNAQGALEPTFAWTNSIPGWILALLPLPDGSLLCGANVWSEAEMPTWTLFHLMANGQLDPAFQPGLEASSVFRLVRKSDGQILVGGRLQRAGMSGSRPLLQLTPELKWDEHFQTDDFGIGGDPMGGGAWVTALLQQPDGELLVGGSFFKVGGYWRRQIVRLTPEGRVDGCFDPGLGLGGLGQEGSVQSLALQADGRIVVGGSFEGCDEALGCKNLTRLLPHSDCNTVRPHLILEPLGVSEAATFPPGGTNVLECSPDLKEWYEIGRSTEPYIYYGPYFSGTAAPQLFLRARQER